MIVDKYDIYQNLAYHIDDSLLFRKLSELTYVNCSVRPRCHYQY